MDRFLLQVNAQLGYANIRDNQRYSNHLWETKTKDKDHGEVKRGDELLVYCTGDVPEHGMTLAFSAVVQEVSPDRFTFHLSEPHWFPSPLARSSIQSLIAEGKLPSIFRRCGIQWFNIVKLDPLAAQQVIKLVETETTTDPGISGVHAGSPADRLIEIHLEQWLVDHWEQVDFGAPLKLYEEDGEAVGQQFDTGSVGRIDLLCEDTSTGNLVVIELKRGQQSDTAMGQLTRYMGWVKEHMAKGRDVEGIVLTPAFDERLRYATKAVPGTRLLRYQTRFEILGHDP